MKQIETKRIKGKIKVMTGLHIGAGNESVEIGGMDNPIIKNPRNSEPYIPGSSIKGKMRSLAEWYFDRVAENRGKPCACGRCDVCRVFGTSAAGGGAQGPTRLIIRDALLSQKSRDMLSQGPIVEEKHENSIDRITSQANPRPIERVIPGVEFDFEMSYRVLDMEDSGAKDNKLFQDVVLKTLALLQHDYLGGYGSRGSGKVQFVEMSDEKGQTITLPEV